MPLIGSFAEKHRAFIIQMFKRYWLPSIAIAVLTIIAVLFWQSGACQDTSHHSSSSKLADVQKEKTAPCSDPELTSIQRIACFLEAINARQDSEDETQRAQSDLDAQWKMAYWARCMFWASIAQVMVGLLGLLAIWRTLHWTREAVKEASEATKIANTAVAVTQKIGEAQIRAYISFTNRSFNIDQKTHYPNFRYQIRNSGNSPAKNFRITFRAAFNFEGRFRIQPTFAPVYGANGQGFGIDIAAGETKDYGHKFTDFPLTAEEVNAIDPNKVPPMFEAVAVISFEDVFGNTIVETQDLKAPINLLMPTPMFQVPFTAFRLHLEQQGQGIRND